MGDGRSASSDTWPRDEPRVVIEVRRANFVIRPSTHVDTTYTTSLASVINAASATDICVVIDPEPIRCDDSFDPYEPPAADRNPVQHRTCRPLGAEVVLAGVVRLHAEGTVWLVDVCKGRFCQLDADVDLRFLGGEAWKPIVAVCVTPTRLIALGMDGTRISANRASGITAPSRRQALRPLPSGR
jgi:hypothetical protein